VLHFGYNDHTYEGEIDFQEYIKESAAMPSEPYQQNQPYPPPTYPPVNQPTYYPPAGLPPQGYYNPQLAPMPVSTSGWAIASLICSIVGIPLLGVIFGFIALNEISNSAGRIAGEGMAKAGIIIGFVVMALGIVLLIIWVIVIGGLILTTPTNSSFLAVY
jgi:hypothetical protein